MTYWVHARSADGIKTFMGMISGPDSIRVHRWCQTEGSIPYTMDIHNVPVLAFQYFADGPVAIAPFWGTARLRLKKSWAPDFTSVEKEADLHINDIWSYQVRHWADTGVPHLARSRTALPRAFRLVIPAFLIQAGQFDHIYATRRHLRKDSGDKDGNDNTGGPEGDGGRRGQVAT